ncbi:hypothetical protein IWQ56_007301, partial [Coemansia nantahalensis]
QQGHLQTIAEDDDDHHIAPNPDRLQQPHGNGLNASTSDIAGGDDNTPASLADRHGPDADGDGNAADAARNGDTVGGNGPSAPPSLQVEIPQTPTDSSRARGDPLSTSTAQRSSAATSRQHTASTPDTGSTGSAAAAASDSQQPGERAAAAAAAPPQAQARRFPPVVNTAARAAASNSNEPGPQTAMLIEYVQNLPSPSSFQPIVYQQNENYSPMEFGNTPIVGHHHASPFQWPLPPGHAAHTADQRPPQQQQQPQQQHAAGGAGSSVNRTAPHQPSPLKRNLSKGSSPDGNASTVRSPNAKRSKAPA